MENTQVGNVTIVGIHPKVFDAARMATEEVMGEGPLTDLRYYELLIGVEEEGQTIHELIITWAKHWVRLNKE